MKKFLSKSLIFGLFLCVALGCSVFNKIKNGIDESQKPQVIGSSDGKFQLTVPGGWRKQPGLHDDAGIQAANPLSELYVIVIADNKTDFGSAADLDYITKVVRDGLNQTLTGPVLGEPVPTTINGLPARQFEAAGEVENIKIKYLYAVVDSPQNYYQIITWTLPSRFDKNRDKLLEVINSFKETGIGDAALPPPPAAKTPIKP
ncbi:MAG TPA: hypothetical protein VK400_05635 [Pyrinomonadaceae bacterium]|nr:hypothetical protein [Pyrinomonadaceae bacterium]